MAVPTKTDHDRFLELVTELVVLERDGSAPPLPVHFPPYTAFVTVGALQLAWRHPDLSPQMKEIVEQVGGSCRTGSRRSTRSCSRWGWDPAADVGDDCPSCPPG